MRLAAAFIFCFLGLVLNAQQGHVLKVSVTTEDNPATVHIKWADAAATQVEVYRKFEGGLNWGSPIANLTAVDTIFTDTVTLGKRYQYYLKATRPGGQPSLSHTYISAGVKATGLHLKGKVIVLVDSNFVEPLQNELLQFKTDLVCDGWEVMHRNVSRYMPKPDVKDIIRSCYLTDTLAHWALFIIGHVPVVYSGEIAPDGHTDHIGAWSTDLYYADFKYTWTDSIVSNTTAARPPNRNIPGDGKFDRSYMPGPPAIAVGRADLYNMPAFTLSDTALTRRYLAKNHNYRTVAFNARRRLLMDDNFGYFNGEAFAQNGWKNGAVLLGKDSVVPADYIWHAVEDSYLWGYGCGGGSYNACNGIGYTEYMAGVDSIKMVFTMLFGSYFGDWDNTDNFMKAQIGAAGYTLTSCWAGRGNWFFHTMGMGLPISHSIISAQYNNQYLPAGNSASYVQTNFMGDPTLCMNPIAPPDSLVIIQDTLSRAAMLSWQASADTTVLGYYVYSAPSLFSPFSLLTPSYVTATNYIQAAPPLGNNVYVVRPVKLEQSITGNYYNIGMGIVDSVTIAEVEQPNSIVDYEALQVKVFPNPSTGVYQITGLHLNSAYKVFNTLGSLVYTQTGGSSINLSGLSNGIYYLQMQTAKGNWVTKKLVKAAY